MTAAVAAVLEAWQQSSPLSSRFEAAVFVANRSCRMRQMVAADANTEDQKRYGPVAELESTATEVRRHILHCLVDC